VKVTDLCADDVRIACPLFQAECGGEVPTSALQLKLYRISMRKAQELNAFWHSVLPETHLGNLVGNNHNVAYAAECSNIYYAVAIWTDPIAGNRLENGSEIVELRRFAISDDAPRFTASRMLSVMRKLLKKQFPDIKKLISYQALDHHSGTIYKAAGWKPCAQSKATVWHSNENRAPLQTESNKIRWEMNI
jgi:hypothetical protein